MGLPWTGFEMGTLVEKRDLTDVKTLDCTPSTLVGLNMYNELGGWRSEERER